MLFELWPNKKKMQRDFFMKITFPKKFWARARSHIAVKTQKSCIFCLVGRIFCRRARGSARAQKFFWNRKVHKISYLLHILDVFISSANFSINPPPLLNIFWVFKGGGFEGPQKEKVLLTFYNFLFKNYVFLKIHLFFLLLPNMFQKSP